MARFCMKRRKKDSAMPERVPIANSAKERPQPDAGKTSARELRRKELSAAPKPRRSGNGESKAEASSSKVATAPATPQIAPPDQPPGLSEIATRAGGKDAAFPVIGIGASAGG